MMVRAFIFCLILSGAISLTANEAIPAEFKLVAKGSTAKYQYLNFYQQDLSAAAHSEGIVIFGFDGGDDPANSEVRITNTNSLDHPAQIFELPTRPTDIEAMTFTAGYFYISSSLSKTTASTTDSNQFIKFSIDRQSQTVNSFTSTKLRPIILSALISHFSDHDWILKIASLPGKKGGLNLEGLSASNQKNEIIFGLRSPLWVPLDSSANSKQALTDNQGEAILVFVKGLFGGRPETRVETVSLEGKGIRGMEYITDLGGYVIIAGPAEKADGYSLWFYDPNNKSASPIKFTEFQSLCRPESILAVADERIFHVLSEESGAACENSTFNMISISY